MTSISFTKVLELYKFSRLKRSAGFTLLEMLVVIVLVAIMSTLAAPAMSGLSNSMQVRSAASSMHTALQLARSESAKRISRVVLCVSSDGVQCSSTAGWHQGWLVFVDANNNAVLDNGEAVLQVVKNLPANLKAQGNGLLTKYISFTPAGEMQTIGGAFQAGTLTVCTASGSATEGRLLVIGITGRVRTEKVTLSSCV